MKLTLMNFNYLKEGKPTPRKLLVLSKPSDSYFGVEYDDELELNNIYDYLAAKEELDIALKLKYGIGEGTNYKRFKIAKIENLTEEKIEV
jgi:hypothetical protein